VQPSFLPDGTAIAYLVPAALTGQARLFLISAGGGAPRATGRESLIAGTGKWPFLDPVLSPDGSKVAYMDAPEARVAAMDGSVGKLATYVAESASTSGVAWTQAVRRR